MANSKVSTRVSHRRLRCPLRWVVRSSVRRTLAGKNKMDTLVAIGRNLLTTIHPILRTGVP
jgi:hypothetical protein